MALCAICGAALEAGGACPYAVPLDRAPGIGNVGAVAVGKLSLSDHELHIARWRVHHPDDKGTSPKVMAWARERIAREGHLPPSA